MRTNKSKNRLEILLKKITVDKENLDLESELPVKLALKLDKSLRTVQRWRANLNQPGLDDMTRIVEFLQEYDPAISMNDFFFKAPAISKTKRSKLVK